MASLGGILEQLLRWNRTSFTSTWFVVLDQMAKGEKREEYRHRSDYWKDAPRGSRRRHRPVSRRDGPEVPEMDVEWRGIPTAAGLLRHPPL